MFGKRLATAVLIVLIALASRGAISTAASEQAADSAAPAEVAPGDWPMWGYDAQRRAVTPLALAAELHLQWVHELPRPARAWPAQIDDRDKLEFDLSYSPVVAGRAMFVASMVTDSLAAYDTRTGKEQWRFYADGPMRLAPVAYGGNVYAVSDDSFLYCLDAATGELKWRFQGGPEDRRLLGNGRLISRWPARGGPVVADGRVYFAASVWPLMGTFIHALDAETGEPVWLNSGSGSVYNLHQHGGADAFGGVAPQGYLAVAEGILLVAGGRTPPAAFELVTGKRKYFRQAVSAVGKAVGGYRLAVQQGWFHNHGWMYSLQDGAQFDALEATVLADDAVYVLARGGKRLEAYAPQPDAGEVQVTDRMGRGQLRKQYSHRRLWQEDLETEIDRLYLRAGDRLYGGGADGRIVAIDLPHGDQPARVIWKARVEGGVWEMLAADQRLFVVTREGAIYCFGADRVADPGRSTTPTATQVTERAPNSAAAARVRELLEHAGDIGGYALVLGAGSDGLVGELVRQSGLHVIVVDPDPARVESFRRYFSDLGWYGRRVACHAGDPLSFPFPPYLAELIVVGDRAVLGDLSRPGVAERLFQPLRPYGGAAFLPLDQAEQDRFAEQVRRADTTGAVIRRAGPYAVLERPGALPGAGQWTHQYADAANTAYSADSLAKAPLGVLWFGGPANEHLLPRHGNGPIPHVVGGRLFILGVETLSARDVYTGRELWVKELPGIGHPFTDLGLEQRWRQGVYVHMSQATGIGANYIGSPYVSLADGIYVRHQNRVLRLDPKSGETLGEFPLPGDRQAEHRTDWGYLSVWDDLLITTVAPHVFDERPIGQLNWNALSSSRLVVLNRYSGHVMWTRQANFGFRHNAIVAGGGTVFAIDGLSAQALKLMARRGAAPERAAILALDARTGQPRWKTDQDVFGTWLGYSEKQDVLIQAGRRGISGDRRELSDEPNDRIIALRGSDGTRVWDRSLSYAGPLALGDDVIVPGPLGRNQGPAALLDLVTGRDLDQPHPLTGQKIPWSYSRTYGCSTHNLSRHLVTFRSGAAGFADLTAAGGTANLSGFRAGCTNNLIVADGVLSAPDYTRTCTCSYQQQTSLALIHMPETELWMSHPIGRGPGAVRRLGLNLAAPGNRISPAGTLWLNYPSVGGLSPDIPVRMTATGDEIFRLHASLLDGDADALPWVAGSGIIGLQSLELELVPADEAGDPPRSYTVRLHFAEPEPAAPGRRVFDVSLQGETVLAGFDVTAAAGGERRAVVKEHRGVLVRDTLRLELQPAHKSVRPPLLCGIELVLEP